MIMQALGFLFGGAWDLIKKLPIWGWVIGGAVLIILAGGWAWNTYVNAERASYERRLAAEQLAKDNAKIDRDVALGDAVTSKAQRDAFMRDLETAKNENNALATGDAQLRQQLNSAQAAIRADKAEERAALGDPDLANERLARINSEIACTIDQINNVPWQE